MKSFKSIYTPSQEIKFETVFNRPIREFWDDITGFDIIKFDAWIDPKEGISLYDMLVEQYDTDTAELVSELCKVMGAFQYSTAY